MHKKIFNVLIIVIIVVCIITIVYKFSHSNANIFEDVALSDLNNTVNSDEEIYIIFYSSSCISCKKLERDIKELEKKYDFVNDLKLYGIDVGIKNNYNEEILSLYEVTTGVPVITKFIDGAYIDSLSTDITQDELVDFFSYNLE
jgi:thiol-disulfide isomerase/thioredoxin